MDGGGKVAGLVRVTHMDHGLTRFFVPRQLWRAPVPFYVRDGFVRACVLCLWSEL